MEASPTQQTSLLYKYYRVLIIPALLWYVWMAHYVVTSTAGEIQIYTSWFPAFGVFVITPINICLGFLLMRRLPNNVIGPVLIVYACATTSEMIIDLIVPVAQGALSEFVLSLFMFPSLITLLVCFPDGKPPSRVASVIFAVLYGMCLVIGTTALFSNPDSYGTSFWNGEALPNPFYIEAFAPVGELYMQTGLILITVIPLTALLLTIYRYIRTTPIERKQLRLVVFGFLLPTFLIPLPLILEVSNAVVLAATLGLILATTTLPLAVTVGILFYRLWDIDVIIRRTLIYAVVSALLALTYFAIVLTTQTLLSGFIPEDNTLLIVISTLVIAALFNPLQQRVQRVIDRLFYRKRYDAEATLEQFSEIIRDAMDAQAIEQHIVDTVTTTIQPESISLWVVDTQKLKSAEGKI